MAEVTDIRRLWKKQKRRRRFWQALMVLALLVLFFVIAVNWGTISSYLVLPDADASLRRETAGELPVAVDGSKYHQLLSDEDHLLIVQDVSVDRYDAGVGFYDRYPHSLTEPRADFAGHWTVVYAPGAYKAVLYREDRLSWEWTGEDRILTAAVSKEGKVAIAGCSGLYSSRVTVYNKNKKELLKLDTDEQVTVMEFSENDACMAVASTTTKAGALVSSIRQLRFGNSQADYELSLPGEWVLKMQYTKAGNLMVVCNGGVYLFDPSGKQISHMAYPAELLAVTCNSQRLIFSLESTDPEKSRLIMLSEQFDLLCDLQLAGKSVSLSLSDKRAVAVTEESVYLFAADGMSGTFYQTRVGVRYAAYLNGRMIAVTDQELIELFPVK